MYCKLLYMFLQQPNEWGGCFLFCMWRWVSVYPGLSSLAMSLSSWVCLWFLFFLVTYLSVLDPFPLLWVDSFLSSRTSSSLLDWHFISNWFFHFPGTKTNFWNHIRVFRTSFFPIFLFSYDIIGWDLIDFFVFVVCFFVWCLSFVLNMKI